MVKKNNYEKNSGAPMREERSLRQELFALHETAAAYFHEAFHAQDATGNFMREYWVNQRKFDMALADEFQIGAAAPDATATDGGLVARLREAQFSEEALRQCGLFFIRDDEPLTMHTAKPRFRGRLMIPIRDHQGRVSAFAARQTALTPSDAPAHEAKYINSPETPIFTKGAILFNLDRARAAVAPDAPFVLVEGHFDALRCWSVGIKTAVAFQGATISKLQLALLRRYHTQVECLFDTDAAGQSAAMRLLPLALWAGLEPRFLTLTPATEAKTAPDQFFLKRGKAAHEELRAHARSAMAFACGNLLPCAASAKPNEKIRAMMSMFDIVQRAESEPTRHLFIEEAANHLCLPLALVRAAFKKRARAAGLRETDPAKRKQQLAERLRQIRTGQEN